MAPVLCAVLAQSYSLEVSTIEQADSGMMAAAYTASDAAGQRWWLKVRPPIPGWPMCKEEIDAALRVTIELRAHVRHARVVIPLLSEGGEPTVAYDEYLISVYPYLDLRSIGHRTTWSDDLLKAVARAMAAIHSYKPTSPVPHVEDFALWPHESLPRGLAALKALDSKKIRPGQRRAQEIVARMERDLTMLIDSYAKAQRRIDRRRQLALCHMDLTPNNLTLDTEGQIHIVDWDQLQIAPPEFDLRWLLSPGRYDVALDAYESAGGSAGLDPLMFAFYFHRRCLAEELACNVAAILLADRTDQQDLDDISQIESIAWAFDDGMQSWITEVENGLAARRNGRS